MSVVISIHIHATPTCGRCTFQERLYKNNPDIARLYQGKIMHTDQDEDLLSIKRELGVAEDAPIALPVTEIRYEDGTRTLLAGFNPDHVQVIADMI